MERREDFRAILLDDLGFGVTFLGETASQTLEFPVASDGCAWIGVSRNLWEGTVTAVPCDAGVGLSDIISLARSSDRISYNNFPSIFFQGYLSGVVVTVMLNGSPEPQYRSLAEASTSCLSPDS